MKTRESSNNLNFKIISWLPTITAQLAPPLRPPPPPPNVLFVIIALYLEGLRGHTWRAYNANQPGFIDQLPLNALKSGVMRSHRDITVSHLNHCHNNVTVIVNVISTGCRAEQNSSIC